MTISISEITDGRRSTETAVGCFLYWVLPFFTGSIVVLEKVNLREDVFKFGKLTEVWLDAAADSTLKSLKWGTRTFLGDHIVFLAPSQIIHPHITHKPPHPPVSQIQPQFQLETPAVMWQITSVFQFWNHIERRENSDDFSTLWPEKWRFLSPWTRRREKKSEQEVSSE